MAKAKVVTKNKETELPVAQIKRDLLKTTIFAVFALAVLIVLRIIPQLQRGL